MNIVVVGNCVPCCVCSLTWWVEERLPQLAAAVTRMACVRAVCVQSSLVARASVVCLVTCVNIGLQWPLYHLPMSPTALWSVSLHHMSLLLVYQLRPLTRPQSQLCLSPVFVLTFSTFPLIPSWQILHSHWVILLVMNAHVCWIYCDKV